MDAPERLIAFVITRLHLREIGGKSMGELL
jgi:hypothetical protein